VSSASAEGRQAILNNPVFVRVSDQQNLSRPTGADISSPFGPVRPPLAELPPPYDFQSAVYDAVASDAVVRPPGPTTALGRAIAAEAATRRPPTPAYAADYATVRTAVHTTAQTLTAQSLLLLSRKPASPQSSSHSSVHHWLESTENMAPPPSLAESTLSSDRSEPQPQALPLGADATTLAPRTAATSRAASRSTRHSRRSATSSIAAEILGYSREMSGHLMNMMGHFQAKVQTQHEQSQNHVNQILAQNEMQRLDAKQREDSIRNENLNREELFIRMKISADQANVEREKAQTEANQKREQDLMKMKTEADESTRKREQLFMEHELKRQKMDC